MSGFRRAVLLALLGVLAAVPLRAFGVVGEEGPTGLSVSASLGGCGVAGDGILCRIDASFGGVDDADNYTASVTLADGSVQDVGSVGAGEGGGSTSIYVPYVGSGTYSVTITAWGSLEDAGDEVGPEPLERDSAEIEPDGSGAGDDDEARDADEEGSAAGDAGADQPVGAGTDPETAAPPSEADPAPPVEEDAVECAPASADPESSADPPAEGTETPGGTDPAERTDLLAAPADAPLCD